MSVVSMRTGVPCSNAGRAWAISKAQADEFYATYYAPQNITLILVGDFAAAPQRLRYSSNYASFDTLYRR